MPIILSASIDPSNAWVHYVICSEKRDLPEIFMTIEILAWIDSSIYADYNGASFYGKSKVMATFIRTDIDRVVF